MTFPETLDEFLEQYQFRDTEQIYTNGSELIPVFRVRQWFDHLHGAWQYDETPTPAVNNPYGSYRCSACGGNVPHKTAYCPFCGADLRGDT